MSARTRLTTFFRRAEASIRYRIRKRTTPLVRRWNNRDLARRLDRWSRSHPTASIVQIGSHNGRTGDPLSALIDTNNHWRVVFVEPNPDQHAKLAMLRADPTRFVLVCAAVTEHDGTVTMNVVDRSTEMPDWVDQLTSIDRQTVLKHSAAVPGLEAAIREFTVDAMTLATLMRSTETNTLDLLHIDTEGHDAVILDQLDFSMWNPTAVLFEHRHLAVEDRERCERRLRSQGFDLRRYHSDTLAIR